MQKTLIALSVASLLVVTAQAETSTSSSTRKIPPMPAKVIMREAKVVEGRPVMASGTIMMMEGGMMDVMISTGDPKIDEQIKAIRQEMEEKVKAIRVDYDGRVRALIGDKNVMFASTTRRMPPTMMGSGTPMIRDGMVGTNTPMGDMRREGMMERGTPTQGRPEMRKAFPLMPKAEGGISGFFKSLFGLTPAVAEEQH